MSADQDPVCIETDLFLFEAPPGYTVETLDEQAELVGPNDEFLVVSSYTVDEDSSEQVLAEFASNISSAMVEAADEPDLIITGKLNKEIAPSGFPVWSVLAKVNDESLFFDQYAVVQGSVAVVVTVEGNYQDRASSAVVEEAVHSIEFKSGQS